MPIAGVDAAQYTATGGFGNNNRTTADNHRLLDAGSHLIITAQANETPTTIGFFSGSTGAGAMEIGLHRITEADGSTPITPALITSDSITLAGETNQWVTKALAGQSALPVVGALYAASFRVSADVGTQRGSYLNGACALSADTGVSALQPTFVESANGEYHWPVYVETEVAAGLSCSETLESAPGTPRASETLDFFLYSALSSAPVHTGTLTTDAAGLFTLTGLEAYTTAGAHYIVIKAQADDNIAGVYPITVA